MIEDNQVRGGLYFDDYLAPTGLAADLSIFGRNGGEEAIELLLVRGEVLETVTLAELVAGELPAPVSELAAEYRRDTEARHPSAEA